MSNEIIYPAVASGLNCGVFLNVGEPAGLTSYNNADATMSTEPSDALVEREVFQNIWNSVTADGPCSRKSKQTSDCSGKCHLCSNSK